MVIVVYRCYVHFCQNVKATSRSLNQSIFYSGNASNHYVNRNDNLFHRFQTGRCKMRQSGKFQKTKLQFTVPLKYLEKTKTVQPEK